MRLLHLGIVSQKSYLFYNREHKLKQYKASPAIMANII